MCRDNFLQTVSSDGGLYLLVYLMVVEFVNAVEHSVDVNS
jgi:hypothetical protein